MREKQQNCLFKGMETFVHAKQQKMRKNKNENQLFTIYQK